MKIGLIFYGLPRSTEFTLPSITKYIINEFKSQELFIESCFSYQTSIVNPRSKENCKLASSNYDFFNQYNHSFIETDTLQDELLHHNLLKFGDFWKDDGLSLRNLLIQLATIKTAYLNCKKNDCEFYIFARPDLFIGDFIPFKEFISKNKDRHAIMIPSWQWWEGGVNDRFAVATKSAAEVYAHRYDQVLQYCEEKNSALQSEKFLYDQIKAHHIKIKTCHTKMTRVRASGQFWNEDFSSIQSMGGYKRAFVAQINQTDRLQTIIGLLKLMIEWIRTVKGGFPLNFYRK